jgi:CubicO group peptidase (beta-lactamase class C family)
LGSVLLLAGCVEGQPSELVSGAPVETEPPEPFPGPTDAPVAAEWSGQSRAEYAAQADKFLNALADGGLFSGAVLVARDGEVLLAKGYGIADRERGLSITPQTRFRLGGFSQQFVSMAILMLEAEDKLDLQDPACDYLTECPVGWDGLTIHHLLSGASGLGSHLVLLAEDRRLATPLPPEEVISLISDAPSRHLPGEEAGFGAWCSDSFLLAQIIENASAKSLDEFMQQEIFAPIGMEGTGPASDHGDLALAYENNSPYLSPSVHPSVVAGYASHWSTVEDLLRWDQALYTDKLVPHELLDRMFSSQGVFEGEEADFLRKHGRTGVGYSWFIGEELGRRNHRYWGGTPGTWDYIDRYPDDRVTIIILSNQGNADMFTVGSKLAKLLFEPE